MTIPLERFAALCRHVKVRGTWPRCIVSSSPSFRPLRLSFGTASGQTSLTKVREARGGRTSWRKKGERKERGGGELKRVHIYIERERRIRALPCALRWKRSERGGRKERDAVAREITILAKAKEPKAKGRSVLHVACGTTTTLRR